MHTPRTIRTSSGAETIRQTLLDEIGTGIEVIRCVDDLAFRGVSNGSSVGQQFRHNLDFLNALLNGVAVGRIDYARRERNPRVEQSREYAIEQFYDASDRLTALTTRQMGSMVSLRSEIDGAVWLSSTVARELEFLLSHTIHHHALIAEKLSIRGFELDASLGVARSTHNYRLRMAA